MKIHKNLRVYGLLFRNNYILVAEEKIGDRLILKFHGGGVESNETPENALSREFREEGQINIFISQLIYTPGTMFSSWTQSEYTPLYYEVSSTERPTVPQNESLKLHFIEPSTFISSLRVAMPEIIALQSLCLEKNIKI